MRHKVPSHWKAVSLGDIGELSAGGTPRTKVSSFWKNGTIRWMTSGEIHSKRILEVKNRITEEGYKNSNATLLPKRTVLVALAGQGKTRGTVAITEIELSTNQSVGAVQLDRKKADPLFVFYNLDNRYQELRSMSMGNGRAGLNLNILRRLSLHLPPVFEQTKIAKILSTWDRAIEALGKLIEAKTRRFLWLIHTSTTDPSQKQGWNQTCIGEIGNIIKGKGITKDDLTEKGVPCIRYADLYTKYDFVVREINSYVSAGAADLAQPLKKGDIIFAGSGETAEDIGKCAAYLAEHRQAVVGGDTLILRQKNCDSNYLAYALNSPRVNKQKSTLGHGHSVVHLYGKDLKKICLSLPSENQQKKVASMLNAAKTEIDLLKKLSEHCVEQKRGLMQKLLTGKIRVSNGK